MAYHTPNRLDQAFDILEDGQVSLIAGGTDWFPMRGDRISGEALLDVAALPGFRGISRADGLWRFGAATRWSEILRADLPPAFDGLKAAAREVGSVQIQNAGTIAGNLCNASPAADGVPPLLTLEASVELVSRAGRRALRLDDFLTGVRRTDLRQGELLAAVLVPDPPAGALGGFVKAGNRRYLVISTAMVAMLLRPVDGRIAEARVAVGACSPVAMRLSQLEADLRGQLLDRSPLDEPPPAVTPAHLAPLTPISDLRGSADHRRELAGELIGRLLADLKRRGAD